jgi:Na+-transporting NADH:ubiquinone oxidoreductase subunit F
MLEMIIGIGLFTAIIIALVVIILAAKSQLVASGSVSLVVNDERTVEAPVGSKLLAALARGPAANAG